jgi:phospholipid/cholesterol/gamma-HCH transport system ATP-binding protein
MNLQDAPIIISLIGLEKSFHGKPILRGVTLDVHEGQTLVILGGSGEGKSVLLRHLNGLLTADKGKVIVGGRDLAKLSEEELAEVRKEVGMVFQLGALFDSLTVYENVSYPLREHGGYTEEQMRARVREVLDMVELHKKVEDLYPSEISGGMKKRVALARTIAVQPRVVLYDEPTTGLDPLVSFKISELIRDLQKHLGLTAVVITHDMKNAFVVADRFAMLDQGKVRFTGSPDEARATSDELMQEFLKAAF